MVCKRVTAVGVVVLMIMVVVGTAVADQPISTQIFWKKVGCTIKCGVICAGRGPIPEFGCFGDCVDECVGSSALISESQSLCTSNCLHSKGICSISEENVHQIGQSVVSCYDSCKEKSY